MDSLCFLVLRTLKLLKFIGSIAILNPEGCFPSRKSHPNRFSFDHVRSWSSARYSHWHCTMALTSCFTNLWLIFLLLF